MELCEAIKNRRSVRKFTDYYVTDEEILSMLDSARRAPSWVNFQAWEFIVIRDKDTIRKVTETFSPTNPARSCSFSSSVLIAACAVRGISGFKQGVQRTKFDTWFMFDLGLAVQNLCLSAHELGLGSVIVGSMDHDECRKILNLPEEHEVVVVIPVGRPDVGEIKPPKRKELREIVYLNQYGIRFVKEV